MGVKLPKSKWAFAIGTTSRGVRRGCRPDRYWHYLIADVDHDSVEPTLRYLIDVLGVTDAAVYPTPHGWHVYTNLRLAWSGLLDTLRRVPNVDQAWLHIGAKRGYLFLADYKRVRLPWPVQRMVIWHHDPKDK